MMHVGLCCTLHSVLSAEAVVLNHTLPEVF